MTDFLSGKSSTYTEFGDYEWTELKFINKYYFIEIFTVKV